MANLSDLTSHNAKLEILHPGTGQPIGLTVEILPPDSPQIKGLVRNLRDKRRFKAQRNIPVTSIDDEKASVDLCLTATIGWEWTVDGDGEPGNWNGSQPSFDRTILSEMLSRDWIREQIDRQLADEKAFFSN